jgi:predicted nuclease of predicted toxin-antitoxin system
MKLLLDANLSPRIAGWLREDGHEATHVIDHGLLSVADEAILAHAVANDQVIVSADSDFTAMLALRGLSSPSLVLLRSADHLTPSEQAALLRANLPSVAADLEAGAVVSLAQNRLRVRPLPVT